MTFNDIDKEWAQFMSAPSNKYGENDTDTGSGSDLDDEDDDESINHIGQSSNKNIFKMTQSKKEENEGIYGGARNFSSMCGQVHKKEKPAPFIETYSSAINNGTPPVPSDLYISTKSKIEFLNCPIDIKKLFWDIKVMPYSTPSDGVIKKQIKFNSFNLEELNLMQDRLKQEGFYEEQIIKSINNPNGRIKFKDVRKLSVGISKKDIMSYRSKKKSAFYNCFVMILRIKINDIFREFHVKIFNTGKIELPGMQTTHIHETVMSMIFSIIQPHIDTPLSYQNCSNTILINSNFNCGFYINREALYYILKNKYNIDAIYDPCSYPGIQCKFYYDTVQGINLVDQKVENNTNNNFGLIKVSFMIFRTGSVLIVGRCNEHTLNELYSYIKLLLHNEYAHIGQVIPDEDVIAKNQVKNKKIRKKTINVTCDHPLIEP
jgi:hypothetical protein